MDLTRKRAKIWLSISVVLMLVSMIFVSVIQSSGGKVTIKDLRWETSIGVKLSGLLFVPAGVSAENKAPAIVTSHGMFNNREMQDANFVELSRRGYVVLAIDMPSHGHSENVPIIVDVLNGMYEAVKMLASLDYVDSERIGITGHSLGGWSCDAAVGADNEAPVQLISAALLNCADATYKNQETQEYVNIYGNRDVGIIAAQYDEFFMVDTDENGNPTSPRDYVQYGNAQSFLHFGKDPTGLEKRSGGTIYREVIDGKEAIRVIYNPAITHPWSHFSKRSTTATIEFFDEALGAPRPIAAANQVWQWKEFFNLVGLIGFAIFVVNFTILMLYTPFFSPLRAKEIVAPRTLQAGGKAWFWGGISATALFGAIVFIPVLSNINSFTITRQPWAQSSPWGISFWAAVVGLFAVLSMIAFYNFYGKKNGYNLTDTGVKIGLKKLGKTVLLAIIVVSVSYGCVFFADYFFKSDFRIWVLAVKAFDATKIYTAVFPYMVLFLIYYLAQSVAANSFNYNTLGKKQWVNTAVVAFFNAIPPLVILAIQYIKFFITGFMVWTDPGSMFIVWLIPILVILPVTTIMSRKIYRVTGNPYLPGIINGIIATLISCSNTLTWL
ncbi:MAG TPA: hypothetical protein DCE11_06570 [Ruminiclostridium sp.]|jgi:dienelactone hydrolase|nr:alpha/beta hydrolase [Clostridiaceae bacterium]HAA25763.1 hypothetical protein [Ruminiclostridium sp.]